MTSTLSPTLPSTALQTQFEFVLPRGYVDSNGAVHRQGTMRLACARDEIYPQSDARVRENPSYLTVILLTRTITSLGTLPEVNTYVVEGLYASDLAFLQDLYRRINQEGHSAGRGHVPDLFDGVHGGHRRRCDGGIVTYVPDRLFEEVAYVAYYLHWPLDQILDLEHPLRSRLIDEVGKINVALSE